IEPSYATVAWAGSMPNSSASVCATTVSGLLPPVPQTVRRSAGTRRISRACSVQPARIDTLARQVASAHPCRRAGRAINVKHMPTVIPAVQAVLDDLVEHDVERGLQVAAYLDGQLVLDTWSGLADAGTQRLVDRDTLFLCFSCGKGVVATAIHILAEHGRIDYDTSVAHY